MVYIALVSSLLVALMGALGIVSPDRLLALVRRLQAPRALLAVAGLRVLMGTALLFAAPASKAPQAISVFGVLAIVSGLLTLIFKTEQIRKWIEWWTKRPPAFLRAWAVAALAIGVLLVWALLP